ncbi:C-C motif chemokine 22 [Talpa occidentalis]|uniref:C-C motif chemokine 22 n=1 Tax=Talpa occidentalis TaxID=50954 RepID=UPI00188DCF0B|nr:C-C motif chemokine 22 [Talpa occidentalis]
MANLRPLSLAALILLAMALQATEAGPYGANVEDSVCCRDYIRRTLPLRVVRDFYWTSDSCPRPGVVLLTFRNLKVCANPNQSWVKRIIQHLSK